MLSVTARASCSAIVIILPMITVIKVPKENNTPNGRTTLSFTIQVTVIMNSIIEKVQHILLLYGVSCSFQSFTIPFIVFLWLHNYGNGSSGSSNIEVVLN